MEPIRIPRYLDTPHQLLLMTADDLVPFALFFVVGIATETLPLCILLGVAVAVGFRRYRSGKPDGYLMHMLYWTGLLPLLSLKARTAINPFMRRVLP